MKRRDFLVATGVGVAGAAGVWYFFDNLEGDDAPVYHPGNLTDDGGGSDGGGSDGGGSDGADDPGSDGDSADATSVEFPTNGDFPADEDPSDGFPPEFPDPPAAPDVDPSAFETTETNGEDVPLVPIDVVEKWYRRGEARFVDARGLNQYKNAHIYGAVDSPAQRGSVGGGIDGWPTDDRIVTYCGCPHHLSSMRAAGLMKADYTRVYAIDEGFGEWANRSYPMAGTVFESGAAANVREWTLEGVVDPRHTGAFAWAHAGQNQEAAPIAEDGTFTLVVKFPDVTGETPVEVETPAFSVTRPLRDLADGTITGP